MFERDENKKIFSIIKIAANFIEKMEKVVKQKLGQDERMIATYIDFPDFSFTTR